MIFVDESIQHDLGYICVGFAYCQESPDVAVQTALAQVGLTPGVDEYKSGYRMVGSNQRKMLRDKIHRVVLETCKLGIYIAAIEERPTLCTSIATVLEKLVYANKLEWPQDVFVDQGIFGKNQQSELLHLQTNCDSRLVSGIQLADFVAYHCSYLLKCELSGAVKKIYMPDDEPHPLAGEEVELDWILRTNLRRHFFVEPRNEDEITGDDWFFKLAEYGAFFSPHLAPLVKTAAAKTFDSMYFGCVW
jgi:hypothetical protein